MPGTQNHAQLKTTNIFSSKNQTVMQPIKDFLRLSNDFIVRDDHVNDEGTLATCNLLREITSLYDKAIVVAFGDLSVYKILTSSYQLNVINQAHLGDQLRFQSDAIIYFGVSLEVTITVNKQGKKNQTLATGHFIFNLENKFAPIGLS